MTKTAILVDGGFYKTRARTLLGEKTPKERAEELEKYCLAHLKSNHENAELYRLFEHIDGIRSKIGYISKLLPIESEE